MKENCHALSEQVDKIRRYIEVPWLYNRHFQQDSDRWSKFCVAMDTLEDSLLAIEAYVSAGLGNSDGERYLRLYGIFQATFLQQDAIRALWEVVIETPFPEIGQESAWKKIREVRNHSAGHPIEVRRLGLVRRTFVTRMELEHDMLSLITDHGEGQTEYWGARIGDLVADYLSEAA